MERPNLKNEFRHKGQRPHHRRVPIALRRGKVKSRRFPKSADEGEDPEVIAREGAAQGFIERRKLADPYPRWDQFDDLFQDNSPRESRHSKEEEERQRRRREEKRHEGHNERIGLRIAEANAKIGKIGQIPAPPTYSEFVHPELVHTDMVYRYTGEDLSPGETTGYSLEGMRQFNDPLVFPTSSQRSMLQTRHQHQQLENPLLLQKIQGQINSQPSISQVNHYTISQDHTAGEMARRSNLLANFGKKWSSHAPPMKPLEPPGNSPYSHSYEEDPPRFADIFEGVRTVRREQSYQGKHTSKRDERRKEKERERERDKEYEREPRERQRVRELSRPPPRRAPSPARVEKDIEQLRLPDRDAPDLSDVVWENVQPDDLSPGRLQLLPTRTQNHIDPQVHSSTFDSSRRGDVLDTINTRLTANEQLVLEAMQLSRRSRERAGQRAAVSEDRPVGGPANFWATRSARLSIANEDAGRSDKRRRGSISRATGDSLRSSWDGR